MVEITLVFVWNNYFNTGLGLFSDQRLAFNTKPERIDRMLMPQFTIFRLMIFIAVCAVISWIAMSAVRGEVWSIAIMLTLFSFAIWAVLQFILVTAGYIITLIASKVTPEQAVSPFATDRPAPQILPPSNIDKE
ncbi:MAG: hypothetical protein COA78_26115 [Blastopirellula sp.]|nr:MAG: hypothetical protein COA78_26115 [Blastopirellula sp.]